jgi:hypothetical protein
MFCKMQDPDGKWWGFEMGTDNLGRPRVYSLVLDKTENFKVPVVSWDQAGIGTNPDVESAYDHFKTIVEGAAREYACARRGV